MTTVTLTINEHRIPLRDDIDVAALTEEIVEAVRDGAGFIHVDDTHGQKLRGARDAALAGHDHAVRSSFWI
ncbi:MAG: hypothetical protein ACJLS2_04115 [Microcella pacifica]